jgi:hypothetical protein
VSLQLQNHLLAPEKIALTSTPFSTPDGLQHITGRISFDPASLEILAQGTGVAKVLIDVTSDFHAGLDYQAEIMVQATHAKRVPIILTILPPDPLVQPSQGADPTPVVKPVPSGG